ncbi:DUF3043 domain-containing protein [Micropruina sp.]|uniref:DUF3043 domain-containing protein n=1 Tax=Micropruina sp. TaxID=2737536 RepID=UPI0039E68BC1
MGLFSPNKNKESAPEQAAPVQQVGTPSGGKSAPTPRRKDAEAARRQRVNPQLSPKEAKQRARQDAAAERRKAAEALDNTPGKKLMRSWIDTRFNPAEWAMPILMTLLVLTLVVTPVMPAIVEPVTYATWAFMGLIVVDIVLMWRGFKKLAAQRIPNEPLKGLLYYGFNRALSLRRMRIPRPVLKRGDTF